MRWRASGLHVQPTVMLTAVSADVAATETQLLLRVEALLQTLISLVCGSLRRLRETLKPFCGTTICV